MKTRIEFAQADPHAVADASPAWPVYPGVKRLLVVRDDRLGDVVLSLPAIARLQAAYPSARIGLLVAPHLAGLARLFRPVDEVLASDRSAERTTEVIRSFRPDAAVCLSRRASAVRTIRRAGVRHVTGTGRRWFSFLFDRRVGGSRRRSTKHELVHAMDLAVRAGATHAAPEFPIDIDAGAAAAVEGWLSRQGIESSPLVIHPGTGGSCPPWPVDRWVELASALSNAGRPLVVSVGPDEESLRRAFGDAGFVVFEGAIPELVALLAKASVAVSNSTGPIHLAAALGRPSLAIHAPWRSCGPQRWAPYGERGWAIVVGSAGSRRWPARRRRRWAAEGMQGLESSVVERAIEALLAGESPSGAAHGSGWPSTAQGVNYQ